jgi:hypothetical protein
MVLTVVSGLRAHFERKRGVMVPVSHHDEVTWHEAKDVDAQYENLRNGQRIP